jgi:hypothetical protein
MKKWQLGQIKSMYLTPSSDDACLSPDAYGVEAIYIRVLREIIESYEELEKRDGEF